MERWYEPCIKSYGKSNWTTGNPDSKWRNSKAVWTIKNPPALPLQWNGKTGGFLNFFMKFRQNRQTALLHKITKAPKPLISTVSVNMVAGRALSSQPPGCEAGKGCFTALLRLIITKISWNIKRFHAAETNVPHEIIHKHQISTACALKCWKGKQDGRTFP